MNGGEHAPVHIRRANAADVPLVLFTNPTIPVKNFAEFMAYVKQELDGVIYQTGPHPSARNTELNDRAKVYNYESGTILGGTGVNATQQSALTNDTEAIGFVQAAAGSLFPPWWRSPFVGRRCGWA